jgi:hypothetical protein
VAWKEDETVKTVRGFLPPLITGLKPGVNEISISRTFEAKPWPPEGGTPNSMQT